jgi:hypothetical protein
MSFIAGWQTRQQGLHQIDRLHALRIGVSQGGQTHGTGKVHGGGHGRRSHVQNTHLTMACGQRSVTPSMPNLLRQ